MHLRDLNDEQLALAMERLAQEERSLSIQVLWHLGEFERRKLYVQFRYSSLFAYAVGKLAYSEDQAYRRIQAMRLLYQAGEASPAIEAKLHSGELTLTHLGIAERLVREKRKLGIPLGRDEKINFVHSLAGMSTRAAKTRAIELCPSLATSEVDSIRPLSAETIELRFSANKELEEKLQRLRGLLSHREPNLSLGELVDKACEVALRALDPARPPQKRRESSRTIRKSTQLVQRQARLTPPAAPRVKALRRGEMPTGGVRIKSRYVSAQLRRSVWRRDQGRCQNCGSDRQLELDHAQPWAKGGENSINNLRLLCRACNQRAAFLTFGQWWGDDYLKTARVPLNTSLRSRKNPD